jgi:anion-transporting  ArsA/GET3 family ATPase
MTPISEQLAGLEIVITCGSGGVGKTTMSAALGIGIAAKYDKRVLVLTVDPAKRLATALGIKAIGADPVVISRVRLRRAGINSSGEVSAAMLDMKSAWDHIVERNAPDRKTAERIFANKIYQRISDAFVGAQEYAAMDTLFELHQAGEYDLLVVDTPPSRNALDLLEAPTRLTDYVGARLLRLLSGPSAFGLRAASFAAGPVLRLADRLLGSELLGQVAEFARDMEHLYSGLQQRARQMYRLLRSPQVGFVVVTTLEPGPFAEAEFFCAKLRELTMPLRAIVVNRTLPESLRDPGGLAVARALADNGHVATWLTNELGFRVTTDAAQHLGDTHCMLNTLAQRDARQLARLARLGQVPAATVPFFTDDPPELEGVARIANLL